MAVDRFLFSPRLGKRLLDADVPFNDLLFGKLFTRSKFASAEGFDKLVREREK